MSTIFFDVIALDHYHSHCCTARVAIDYVNLGRSPAIHFLSK
ncbi:MAG: hypothetical protein WBB82_06980 [Limnothrix sp.]